MKYWTDLKDQVMDGCSVTLYYLSSRLLKKMLKLKFEACSVNKVFTWLSNFKNCISFVIDLPVATNLPTIVWKQLRIMSEIVSKLLRTHCCAIQLKSVQTPFLG